MIIGKYRIDPTGNGNFIVEWFDALSKRHLRHVLTNMEQIIERECGEYFKYFIECAELFELAFNGDMEAFFKDPRHKILEFLDKTDIIPGERFDNKTDLDNWHLEQFVIAYNRMRSVNITASEVKLYIKDK